MTLTPLSIGSDVTGRAHVAHVLEEALLDPVFTAPTFRIDTFRKRQGLCMNEFISSKGLS